MVQQGLKRQYFPGQDGDWERRSPEDVQMSSAGIKDAIAFHRLHSASGSASTVFKWQPKEVLAEIPGLETNEPPSDEPFSRNIGPIKRRGPENGLILRHGYIVAEWGDTRQVDMTYSATKSYLATMAGLALDRGLIRDVHDPVAYYVHDGSFASEHNAQITWHHLLQQTSDWQGTLWGKPDWADRPVGEPGHWHERELHTPGTHYKYNDVRVNLTALALLRVWRKPLPEVLREEIMDPIGASRTWEWHGYENSWVTIDGRRMQSVAGGAHWGGGLWINSEDHARFGYLHLRRGCWGDRRLLSEAWIDAATAPGDVNPIYGYMWWLNTDGGIWPSAPHTAFSARGAGTNFVYVDPENDLVVVARWLDGQYFDEFIQKIIGSIKRA